MRAWTRVLYIIPQGTHGIRLWISPLSFILQFLLLYYFWCFFSIYLQLYWQCKCKSCDSYRRPSGEAFVSGVEKERWTLESFACCGKSAKRWWWCWLWQIVVLQQQQQKSINTDVDNVLVSQLLIKATYFLYGFNYLFCDELCVMWAVVLCYNVLQYTLSVIWWRCVLTSCLLSWGTCSLILAWVMKTTAQTLKNPITKEGYIETVQEQALLGCSPCAPKGMGDRFLCVIFHVFVAFTLLSSQGLSVRLTNNSGQIRIGDLAVRTSVDRIGSTKHDISVQTRS